jgi:tRNA G18 (ribose-2'-O)-methylase SpoU
LAKKRKLKIKYSTRENLDKICENKSHEGIVVKCKERHHIDLKRFSDFQKHVKKSEGNIVIMTQNINETHTLGNIIRTGLYLGADHFIVSKENKHLINGSLAKASSGSTETTELFTLKFFKNFLSGIILFNFRCC